jgi:hypothetical protein
MFEEAGAHGCVGSTERGRSSGGWWRSLTLDVEVVDDCDPGEVQRLRVRYTVIRHEPIQEETRVGRSSPKTGESVDISAEFW